MFLCLSLIMSYVKEQVRSKQGLGNVFEHILQPFFTKTC